MHFPSLMEERRNLVDNVLDFFLPGEDQYPQSLHQAMRYSVFAGGKRLRPLLSIFSAEIFSPQDWYRVLPVAAALEMIHTYSLIHDDLPAMDDDDYRRGRLTCHKIFGESTAILAGDALLTHAFEILTNHSYREEKLNKSYWENVSPEYKVKAVAELAKAAGAGGMIAGQVVDLESEQKVVEEEDLDYINSHKTGALISASVRASTLLCSTNPGDLKRLTSFASALGKAFQLVDDLLDVEGDEEQVGKAVGKDAQKEKATYVAICGIERTKLLRDKLYEQALKEIEPFGDAAEYLRSLSHLIVYRKY